MRLTIQFAIGCCLLCCSCASPGRSPQAAWAERRGLPPDPLPLAEGTYLNRANDMVRTGRGWHTETFWTRLTGEPSDLTQHIRIVVQNGETLEAALLSEGRTVSTRRFRVRKAETYLQLRDRREWHMEFFPLIWGCERFSRTLGFTDDRMHLFLCSKGGGGLLVVLPMFGGGGGGGTDSAHMRIHQGKDEMSANQAPEDTSLRADPQR